MIRVAFLLLCVLGFNAVQAQMENPVSWSFAAKKLDAKTYEVHLTANIERGWHTYSQTTPAGGPVPTAIKITPNPLVTLQGSPKEVGKLEKHFEKLFDVEVKQFSNKVDFVQTIKLKAPVKTNLSGTIEFMVCDDTKCLPPTTQKFAIALN